MDNGFRFSWRAILLSPLAVPLVAAGLIGLPDPGGFLVILAIGCAISYGGSVFLLLPSLWTLSWKLRLNTALAGFSGAVLGMLLYFPFGWMMWKSSGADSGPPDDTFAEYLVRQFLSESWIFVVSGAVNALLYWWLARGGRPEVPRA